MAAKDGWKAIHGVEITGLQLLKAKAYFGQDENPRSAGAEVKPAGGEEAVSDRKTLGTNEIDELVDKEPTVAAGDREKVKNDVRAQNLSPVQITALSESLELGEIVPLADVMNKAYGSNPRLSEKAKTARKAGVLTWSKLLENKERRAVSSHIAALNRAFIGTGFVTEMSLVSAWWGELMAVFENDTAGLFDYLSEYARVYMGRGFPVRTVDVAILVRVRGGVSSDKETVKTLGQLKIENAKVREEMAAMRQKLNGLSGGGKGPKCFNCGARGHVAANCPEKEEEDQGNEEP